MGKLVPDLPKDPKHFKDKNRALNNLFLFLPFLSDIDECLVNNGDCQNECINFAGGYSCTCLEGYTPDLKDPRKCRGSLYASTFAFSNSCIN